MTKQLKDFLLEGEAVGYENWYEIPEGVLVGGHTPYLTLEVGPHPCVTVFPRGEGDNLMVEVRSYYFTKEKFWVPNPADESNFEDRKMLYGGAAFRVVYNHIRGLWCVLDIESRHFWNLRSLENYYKSATIQFYNDSEEEEE